jgi:hypothetical protein
MSELMTTGLRNVCHDVSQAMTEALDYQWRLFDLQYQTGMKLLDRFLVRGAGPPVDKPPARRKPAAESEASFPSSPHELRDIERRALDCARRGAPLPRAVYDVRNRRRIDWSLFPEWARPVDPEAFTGTAHEG